MTDDLKQNFETARDNSDRRDRVDQPQEREAFKRDRRIHQTPVSKAELEAREKLRSLPRVVHELTPDGMGGHEVDQAAQSENERRIHFLQKRLGRIAGKAREAFRHRS